VPSFIDHGAPPYDLYEIVAEAENPVPFVTPITACTILERTANGLAREIRRAPERRRGSGVWKNVVGATGVISRQRTRRSNLDAAWDHPGILEPPIRLAIESPSSKRAC
jgi:hypothetical protein